MNTQNIQDDLKKVKNVEDIAKLPWSYSLVAGIVLSIIALLVHNVDSLHNIGIFLAIAAGVAAVYLYVQSTKGNVKKVKWWWMALIGVGLITILIVWWLPCIFVLALFGLAGYGYYQEDKAKNAG